MTKNEEMRALAQRCLITLSEHPVLRRHWEHLSVILKGSTARGYSDEYSDVDFVVFADGALVGQMVEEYRALGLTQREDGVFLPFANWCGHYNLDSYDHLDHYFDVRELTMVWEYSNVWVMWDPQGRYQRLLDERLPALFRNLDGLLRWQYLQIQLNLDWMRQPLRRADSCAAALYLTQVLRLSVQMLFLLEGPSYPCDKWLFFYARQLTGHPELRDMMLQYPQQLPGVLSLEPGLELMDYPAYAQGVHIVEGIQAVLHARYGEAQWIDEWYLYA